MAKKDLSVSEKLQKLFALQTIDSKIIDIHILKGELPIEVSDLEDEIEGLTTRVNRLSEAVENIKTEISNHQINIKESESMIAKYEKQLDTVKNNREFDALTKELELQKLEIQLSEKKIREGQNGLEAKSETHDAAKERLDKKKKDLDDKKVELDKIIETTELEESKLAKKAEKARKGIDERLLKSYDRIQNRYRNGLSVVKIHRDSCGGCFNRIPPQIQIEIGQRKKIVACEHCGRILVDDNIENAHLEEKSEA